MVDYGMGNLRSVTNALCHLGHQPVIVTHPDELDKAEAIILPGVGAFGDTMDNLHTSGLIDALTRKVMNDRAPFLGICIGMEVLFTRSFEHGEHKGLDWLPGDVKRFEGEESGRKLRVPHVGWNSVRFIGRSPLFTGLDSEQDFYFVHSYYCEAAEQKHIAGACNYGQQFAAIATCDNITGVQFHPEKSHRAGMILLRNWLEDVARC